MVNLGVPGFGLTHEIRVFYEFGLLYQPAVVILQFHMNDVDDNLFERVTTVENGRFRFHREDRVAGPVRALKDWLSGSVLQHSSAYNLIRNKRARLRHARGTSMGPGGSPRGRRAPAA